MAKIRAEQLAAAVKKNLAPVYFITGDEPLIVQECCDTIRQAAREQGFSERELHHTDTHFSWDELYNSANALSLFADKKIIEIRIHNGKPADAGSKAIVEYCSSPNDDTLLLLVSPKIDSRSQKSKWFTAIEKVGATVQVWPIGIPQMPRWVDQRLKAAGLHADSEAIDILCARTEGNLLAAVQEIEKLKLAAEDNFIDAQLMTAAVMDSARYDIFGLVDKAIYGDSRSAATSLQGLRSEGTEPLTLLWALTREIRSLNNIKEAMDTGESFDAAARKNGVWEKRKPLFKAALKRIKPRQLQDLIRKAALADRVTKGVGTGNVWNILLDLTLGLAGMPVLTAKTQRLEFRS
ncbi:DNA polymerase III subunit delta [Teredinibacter purpureus]|uniref:DNA polymerase III subunit delta n=1 Tax=Teredinibacter purpureus TaxID=2731756 RepID=UPI0005F83837|nr:DNA polymerase III subunit delta [Teredinibacter purpureus]